MSCTCAAYLSNSSWMTSISSSRKNPVRRARSNRAVVSVGWGWSMSIENRLENPFSRLLLAWKTGFDRSAQKRSGRRGYELGLRQFALFVFGKGADRDFADAVRAG